MSDSGSIEITIKDRENNQWRRQNFATGGGARARGARVPKFVVTKSSRSESHLALGLQQP